MKVKRWLSADTDVHLIGLIPVQAEAEQRARNEQRVAQIRDAMGRMWKCHPDNRITRTSKVQMAA